VSPQRFLLAFLLVDLLFKLLVGLGFLEAMGAHTQESRGELVRLILVVATPAVAIWFASLWWMMRPFSRYDEAQAANALTDEIVRAAAQSSGTIALRIALCWTAEWVVLFTIITIINGQGFNAANLSFLGAMATGPVPIGFGLTVWSTSAIRRDIDLTANARGISFTPRASTLRTRLLMYGLTLAFAPSSYMAAMGASATIHGASLRSLELSVAVGYGAIIAFAIIVSLLVAGTLTAPITAISNTVDRIGREQTSTKPLRRIARDANDELGTLVERTNDMLGRLETEASNRAKVEMELSIANRIQTSILPRRWTVEGLDIAASMITATKVGGDYYDILPRDNGGWLGIGDVSGHGISAGLIMLMLQSVTATIVDAYPQAAAREQVIAINRILAENIRKRMKGNDFVTFTLLRYQTGGKIQYAGAHEELVVWRAATETCERIETPGAWLGVSPDITKPTVENELTLLSGDLLVLYTDGVTEARDAKKTQFGMDRLCATIEASAARSVHEIVGDVVGAVHQWCAVPEDDITVVVARQA
jgi:serine phosphatase RsbU (regulator of sigma subunit)